MNASLKLLSLAAVACILFACKTEPEEQTTTSEPTEEAAPAQETASVITVTGVAIDGSRRNPILEVDGDERPFELPASVDISWENGDTLTIKYIPTDEGDSVIDATCSSVQK